MPLFEQERSFSKYEDKETETVNYSNFRKLWTEVSNYSQNEHQDVADMHKCYVYLHSCVM